MPGLDLRMLQIKLLRLERQVEECARDHARGKVVSATQVSAFAATIAILAQKTTNMIGNETPVRFSETLSARLSSGVDSPAHGLKTIYETLITGHAAIEKMVIEAGHILVPNASGVPKKSVEHIEGLSKLLGIY